MPLQLGAKVLAVMAMFGLGAASLDWWPGTLRSRLITSACALAVFGAMCVMFFTFTVDDTYISLRYARHLATGYNLTFTRDGSAPVEGYTNFLWVVLEAPVFRLGLTDASVLGVVKGLGIAFGAGVILMTVQLGLALGLSSRAAHLAGLIVAAVPYLAFWAVGGLETSAYVFFLVAALTQYLREDARGRRHAGSAGLFVLLALTRPEGVVVSVAVLGASLVARARDRSRAAIDLAVFTGLYGVYFIWRVQHFGYALPNTYYARSGGVGLEQIEWRLVGIAPFVVYLLPWLAIAALQAIGHPPLIRRGGFVAGVLLLLCALIFAAKREWMPGFRYELALVPLVALVVAAALDRLMDAGGLSTASGPLVRAVALTGVGACLIYPALDLRVNRMNTGELERAQIAIGRWMHRVAPGGSVAVWDMGALPYFSDLPVAIDINEEGLLNARTTHHGYDVDAVMSAAPTFIVLPPAIAGRPAGIFGFYSNAVFKAQYEAVTTVAMTSDYLLCVFKHRALTIEAPALAEARRLEEQSFAEVHLRK